ncbi:MAG: hypothetical protein RR825_05285, partial [Ruthenibacterium sp.]
MKKFLTSLCIFVLICMVCIVPALGAAVINSNPKCYRPIKEWYKKECERLGLTREDIAAKYTQVTEKSPICCVIIFAILNLKSLQRKCGIQYICRWASMRVLGRWSRVM